MHGDEVVIRAAGLGKSFGATVALRDVDLIIGVVRFSGIWGRTVRVRRRRCGC
jgi:hypothetical protein